MDPRSTPEEVAFSDEVRAFIRDNLRTRAAQILTLQGGYGPLATPPEYDPNPAPTQK